MVRGESPAFHAGQFLIGGKLGETQSPFLLKVQRRLERGDADELVMFSVQDGDVQLRVNRDDQTSLNALFDEVESVILRADRTRTVPIFVFAEDPDTGKHDASNFHFVVVTVQCTVQGRT